MASHCRKKSIALFGEQSTCPDLFEIAQQAFVRCRDEFDRYGLEIAFAHRTFEWGSDARGTAPAALERSSRHVARAVRQALARD